MNITVLIIMLKINSTALSKENIASFPGDNAPFICALIKFYVLTQRINFPRAQCL